MKIAIIDPILNPGGSSRVIRRLLPAVQQLKPEWQLTFYVNKKRFQEEGFQEQFSQTNIAIQFLKSSTLLRFRSQFQQIKAGSAKNLKMKNIGFLLYRIYQKLLHFECQQIANKYDLLFYPWPFHTPCPKTSTPLVAIFHDLNFLYSFDSYLATQLKEEMAQWLHHATPIVSTHFIKRELEKFYPIFSSKAHVIHLSGMNSAETLPIQTARECVSSMGIEGDYLLYPTNIKPHKNNETLIDAFYLLKQKHPQLKLIFVGHGTEKFSGGVYGLGYRSHFETEALIQCATIVVSTSLYEAGCGPGLDAWVLGTPVAMSNIPSFTEHLKVQGVKATLFDPHSAEDIAHQLHALLVNYEEAKHSAMISQQRMALYDWRAIAMRYIQVFEQSARVIS